MIPSDPDYGGIHPQIAKGDIDLEIETILEGTIREVEEELGLLKENILNIFKSGVFISSKNKKQFHVYGIKILDKENFGPFHFETGSTLWLTEYEIKDNLVKYQQIFIWELLRNIKKDLTG